MKWKRKVCDEQIQTLETITLKTDNESMNRTDVGWSDQSYGRKHHFSDITGAG